MGGLGLLDLTTPAAAPPGSSNAAVGAALLQADNMADPSALAQQPAGKISPCISLIYISTICALYLR